MKIKLGVLFGGKSVEHEISIITALQAVENIDSNKYEVIPIYITKDSRFFIGEDIGDIKKYRDIPSLLKNSNQIVLAKSSNKIELLPYPPKMFKTKPIDYIDLAFPIVHGANVEDGTIQGMLEMLSIPYVGPDVVSSAVCMDKYFMKCILKENGIDVLDSMMVERHDFLSNQIDVINSIEEKFDYPVIVKPNNLGSSVGINIAKDGEELLKSLEEAFTYAQRAIVERAIEDLKEINVAVIGDSENAIASECEEPISSEEILSFEDKYMSNGKGKKGGTTSGSGSMEHLTRKLPADIDKSQRSIIRTMAIDAFKVLGCSGVARADFMIDLKDNKIYLNELNTIPGSLSFYLFSPVGIEYPDLIDKMVQIALKRNREREDLTFSFESNVLNVVDLSGSKNK